MLLKVVELCVCLELRFGLKMVGKFAFLAILH